MGGGRSLLPHNKRKGKKGNGLNLHQERFTFGMRQDIFTTRVVKHWNRLPREAVESPALEVFQKYIDAVLGDMI